MAALAFAAAIALLALRLHRSRHAGWRCLAVGLLLFATLYGMRRFRIAWPDLGRWTVFPLNPYLILSAAYLLIGGGARAVLLRWARRGWTGRPVR